MAQVLTYRDALRATLMEEMDRNPAVVLLGEDIGVYQGTFRITADFLTRCGPNGAGVQLSAQHSQSLEALYAHFPGLWVVAPATPADARGLLLTALRGKDPVVFLENAALYGAKGEVQDGAAAIPFGQAEIMRRGHDVTIISYSRMVHLALVAAEQLAQ